METLTVTTSSCATTVCATTATGAESVTDASSDQGTSWFCAQSEQTPSSSGAASSTTAGSRASTAPSSATRASTYRHCSFAKRMQLLMQSGLIAGITPTSIAQRSPQAILAFASSARGGSDAE